MIFEDQAVDHQERMDRLLGAPSDYRVSRAHRPVVLFEPLRQDAVLPSKAYPGDVGMDLYTYGEHRVWWPGEPVNIPTGVAMALPDGFYAQIIARSSTFRKYGLLVLPGVIDQGWRGELFVQVVCLGPNAESHIPAGSRLAQLIIQRIPAYEIAITDSLPPGERGEAGFGSTGD